MSTGTGYLWAGENTWTTGGTTSISAPYSTTSYTIGARPTPDINLENYKKFKGKLQRILEK